jgi:hypothetical protein
LQNPIAFQDLIDQYKKKRLLGYDFSIDRNGLLSWYDNAENITQNNPFTISFPATPSSLDILNLVISICHQYKKLIENNGCWRLLYLERKKPHNERYPQLLFFGIADNYCKANNIDINGKGPVDFKYSTGYNAKVNVEIKLSTNPNLISGFKNQLEAYNAAEGTNYSVYLVVRMTASEKKIQELLAIRHAIIEGGKTSPEIIVVDGRWQTSASKIK